MWVLAGQKRALPAQLRAGDAHEEVYTSYISLTATVVGYHPTTFREFMAMQYAITWDQLLAYRLIATFRKIAIFFTEFQGRNAKKLLLRNRITAGYSFVLQHIVQRKGKSTLFEYRETTEFIKSNYCITSYPIHPIIAQLNTDYCTLFTFLEEPHARFDVKYF